MFTSFLSKSNDTWAQKVGAGTNVNWPSVPGSLTGNGNSGVITQMTTTPYSIGYIAATYETQVNSAGFGIAYLENQDGQFVGASVQNVSIAAQQYLPMIPKNGTIALQYAPGKNSYPIADMEYVVVRQDQPSPAIANSLKEFLNWAVSSNGGSSPKYLTEFNLVPLPSSVVSGVVVPLINKITG
jgi:phosphate transport system substrate-binding protein